MRDIFRKLYTQQKSNAKQRGVEFLLTLDEWKQIWLDSGNWEQRGRGAEKYCMCRIGDTGPYAIGNVFIDLCRINVRDGNLEKLDSVETKARKSAAMSGIPHPWSAGANNPMHRPEVKEKVIAAVSGANHYKARGVNTPQGFFPTAKAAAEALGMKKPTVEWRARHNKFGFSLPV